MMDLHTRIVHVRERLSNWWNHENNPSPCVLISVPQEKADTPDTEDLKQFWMETEFVIRRMKAKIDHTEYWGQAVPYHFVDFGASAMPCALGSQPEYVSKDTIWAHPVFSSIENVLDLELDTANYFYRTILEVTTESARSSTNHHMVSIYPLNGLTDILAGLYGTENFLVDMIEKSGLVKRAMAHFKTLWINEFHHISGIIGRGGNPGGIGWAGVWSPGTTFPIQEDASYMLSPEMFRQFCLPYLREIIDAMDYPMYHLDGIGALSHLETLLEIENLKVIQWVPGAGKERLAQWHELIKYIISRGKSVQVFAAPDEVDALAADVGAKGLLITVLAASRQQAEQLTERYCR